MRMRLVVVAVVVAAVAIGGVLYWRSRGHAPATAGAPKDAAVDAAARVVRPPSQPALPAEQVTAKQEDDERAQFEQSAAELKLGKDETAKVLAALATMQAARRQLFADLAARKRPIEDVSTQLRELRDQMYATFVKELGKERADKLQERIRAAHGFESAPAGP